MTERRAAYTTKSADARQTLSASKSGVLGPETSCQARASEWSGQTLVIDPLDKALVARLSANSRSQVHWPRTNAKNRVKTIVAVLADKAGLPKIGVPVTVTFRWIVPTRGRRDLDNLASNGIVKASLDSLVEAKRLPDDSSVWVREVKTEMAYEKGQRRLEIVLEPAA